MTSETESSRGLNDENGVGTDDAQNARAFADVEQKSEALEQPSDSDMQGTGTPQNDAEIEGRGVDEQLPDDRAGATSVAMGAAGGGGMVAGASPAESAAAEVGPVVGEPGTDGADAGRHGD